MAEVFGIVANMVTVLDSRLLQEIGSVFGVNKDLKKLKTILSTVKAVLMDAEDQQLNNHELRCWLLRVKDASYDADDILDDFEIQALRQNLRTQHHEKVLCFAFSLSSIVFRFRMSRRIKQVREKFDEIAEDRIKFHLIEEHTVVGGVPEPAREQTHSFVDESQVLGRDEDKHEIVKLLLDMEGQDNLTVVAIQGMGGLGKTTLAQLVYNDERVDTYYESKMWVCASLQFEVKRLTAEILKSAAYNGRSRHLGMDQSQFRHLEMDQLQSRLREKLQGKRFLLVLDDVWNEEDEKWDKLKMLLTSGAKGSKVLITTRSKKVAHIMGASSTYMLESLSNDNCWDLFKRRAFSRGQEEAHPKLVGIGREIVKKCGGVPLAAKSLGSLMRFKLEEHEWESVKDNHIWRLPQKDSDILPALRLSYHHLPFYLKQCLCYCFLFSKGMAILQEDLIQMWISQGFIVHQSGDYHCLYNIGKEYVKELLWRSFFQVVNEYAVEMHDLLHDLVRDVARVECFVREKGTDLPNSNEVRHVLDNDIDEVMPFEVIGALCKLSTLRTLVFKAESLGDDFFSNFTCLRVLKVVIMSGSCPSSVGKLKHLRFLAIASDQIQNLPKSITKLQSLQCFQICCPQLRQLPKDIGKLINLRYLYLDKEASLSHMPFGLRNLTSLRELRLFVVGKGIGCKLKDLHGLVHLGGELRIMNLENVSGAEESAEANLREKQIRWLELYWNSKDNREHMSGEEAHVAVLESMEPHLDIIQSLTIGGYGGVRFPRWMMEASFPRIVSIFIDRCGKCQHLPPFWKLPSLKYLYLMGMDVLQSMESGVGRGQQVWFPRLMELWLVGVPKLECFTPRATANNGIEESKENLVTFPFLEELKLEVCSEELVRSLLNLGKDNPRSCSSLARLRSLKIQQCDDLEYLPEGALQILTSLEKLKLISCPNLIINMNSLSGGGGMHHLNSLKHLEFEGLPKLVSLPEGIQSAAAKLLTLRITHCEGLMELPDWIGKLRLLRELGIWYCPMLQFLPNAMQQLTALEILGIVGCTSLTSWPNWLGSFTLLKNIAISCSLNLPSLPQQLQSLTALQYLYITMSETLMSLPGWMVNLTSLKELNILHCNHLTSRCQKDTGEDWPKISHIPKIEIDKVIIQDN